MDIINTVWLYAENSEPGGNIKATHTLGNLGRGTSVMASISLSYFSEGVSYDQNTVGAAVALVRRWEVFNSDGSTRTVENKDPAGNAEWIDNCASVTFELSVTFARAYAQATLFHV